VHRGPDEGSVDAFGACVLGHRRLRVIDLETGGQPVGDERGEVAAVFNGELYGWDARRQRLVLARERVGKKPLVWTRLADGTLAFASEVKALLRLPQVRRAVDPEQLDAFLALQYVPGGTGLRGIEKLPPGHLLVAGGGSVRVEPYAEPRELGPRSDAEWLELVRAEVREAVERRLVADVPLGALLSGGLDSSVVVALMAQASGYERHLAHELAARLAAGGAAAGARALRAPSREPRSAAARAARFLGMLAAPPAARYGRLVEVFPAALRRELWQPGFVARKTGFGVHLSARFSGQLGELAADVLLDRSARGRGQLRPAAVERLLAEHVSGRADRGHRLWCLVVLELWQRAWVEGVEATPPVEAAAR